MRKYVGRSAAVVHLGRPRHLAVSRIRRRQLSSAASIEISIRQRLCRPFLVRVVGGYLDG